MPKKHFNRPLKQARIVARPGALLLFSVFVGILAGLGAVGFHSALESLVHLVLGSGAGVAPFAEGATGVIPRWLFFLIPTAGGLVSGFLVYRFAPETEGHGTDAMIDNFHNRGGKVRKRVPLVKALASIFTIASGGSAGYEGPVAQIGSGMASLVARAFKMTATFRRIVFLSGTAAGLGAIFKAPLGGALTAVEVLYKEDFESEAFISTIVASVTGYTTYASLTDYTPVFGSVPAFAFESPVELLFYGLLGLLLAPASLLYVKFFYGVNTFFRKLPIANMFKPALGGLGVGLIFYVRPEILAGGWSFLISAMQGTLHAGQGHQLFLMMLSIGLLKILATSLTVASGGSGGVFGPSLFIGGMLGGSFGLLCYQFFPAVSPAPGAFVLVGMGAFFAGAANAPIASVIMVCELTGNYNLLAPLMLTSVIHMSLAKNWSIYRNQVENKFASRAHRKDMDLDVLKNVPVANLVQKDAKIVTVKPGSRLKELEHLLSETDEDIFLVVDNDDKICGLLDVHSIHKAIFDPEVGGLIIVEDMMNQARWLRPDMDLHLALQTFLRTSMIQLPVIDEKGGILCTLRHKDIINAYDSLVRKGHLAE